VFHSLTKHRIPDAPSFLSDIETVEKRMAARKAQIEGMLPRSEAPTAQDPSDTKPQLPPKPGTQQEDSKTGAQAAKPSVSSFAAEKEKRFQKDQLIQTLERVSTRILYLHLLRLNILVSKSKPIPGWRSGRHPSSISTSLTRLVPETLSN